MLVQFHGVQISLLSRSQAFLIYTKFKTHTHTHTHAHVLPKLGSLLKFSIHKFVEFLTMYGTPDTPTPPVALLVKIHISFPHSTTQKQHRQKKNAHVKLLPAQTGLLSCDF